MEEILFQRDMLVAALHPLGSPPLIRNVPPSRRISHFYCFTPPTHFKTSGRGAFYFGAAELTLIHKHQIRDLPTNLIMRSLEITLVEIQGTSLLSRRIQCNAL